MDVFARRAERFAAGGQDAQPRASHQQSVDDLGDRVEDVLAVVEHDEALPIHECSGQLFERRLIRVDVYETGRGDLGCEVDATVDGGQIDEKGPTGAGRLLAAGDLDGQAGLADATRAGQRHQPGCTQFLGEIDQLGVASDERRELRGQADERHVDRAQRRKLLQQTGRVQLEHPLRAREIPETMHAEIDQPNSGELIAHQVGGGLRTQRLPAICHRYQPSRAIYGRAVIVTIPILGDSSVNAGASAQRPGHVPCFRVQGLLRVEYRTHRVSGGRERRVQPIAT